MLRDTFSLQIGFTPLHFASQNHHTGVVEMLIENGASVNVPAFGVKRMSMAVK